MKDGKLKDLRRKIQNIAATILPKEFLSAIYSLAVIGYKPDLKNPKSFNEKLQWYKLYYCPKSKLISECADKYEVRNYLEEKGYGAYLNDLFGVWDRVEDIPWDDLPQQFVLKCTHGCAYNIICPDKNNLDIESAKKKLKIWMAEDFGKRNLEGHYSNIKHRIICEKFLGGNMTDYKFFCFDGTVKFMYISEGLAHDDTATISFFDRNGNDAGFGRADYAPNLNARIPEEYEQLIKLSEELSDVFPFVRVDWFIVNGKVYFSEFTFAPCAGMMKFIPEKYDMIAGEYFSDSIFDC